MLEIATIILAILCLCGTVTGKALAIVTLVYCASRITLDLIRKMRE